MSGIPDLGLTESAYMKTFLSIGTGPGIGLATAERFSREGFSTVLSSRRPEQLEKYVPLLEKNGASSEVMQVDAANEQSIRSRISTVIEKYGAIDVIHYNAASLRHASITEQAADSFLQDLAVNIGGAMVAIQAVAQSMQAAQQGTILLTGGRFGTAPVPEYISLSVGKSGIRALALGLFEDFKSQGIHIATVTAAATAEPVERWSTGVADTFWKLHDTPQQDWVAESVYP
jgi:NADP-dependent 3-hydroxy acid dehydrogenase YdfG